MVQINPKKIIEEGIISNISNEEEQLQQVGIDLTIGRNIVIAHGSCFNVDFNETFNMKDCFAIFNVRSSFSRKGIFVTSGVYDPGFNGSGGCTIYNMSGDTITIDKNTRVGQMVCFEADAANQYDGHYNKTDSIDSKLKREYEDEENI